MDGLAVWRWLCHRDGEWAELGWAFALFLNGLNGHPANVTLDETCCGWSMDAWTQQHSATQIS